MIRLGRTDVRTVYFNLLVLVQISHFFEIRRTYTYAFRFSVPIKLEQQPLFSFNSYDDLRWMIINLDKANKYLSSLDDVYCTALKYLKHVEDPVPS